jgi:hypothetical protein
LVFACTHPQSIVRFEEKMGENCDSKVQFWKKEIEENRSAVHLLQETMQGGSPPQFVGQTKPVGQYSLHSRAILAYYKNKWDKFCQFCGKFCQFCGKYAI